MENIQIKAFFDQATYTVTYLVYDTASKETAIIDSVLDFDSPSGRTSTQSADKVVQYVNSHELKVKWILETHAHADHLSAAPYLKKALGGKIAIGAHIQEVQEVFKKVFNLEKKFLVDGSQFDQLLSDGDCITLGEKEIKIIHTPGHTPACICYLVDDAIFVGDTIFMPDFGTARTDFPGGDAATLYESIKRILELPEKTRIFTGHDYMAEGRDEFAWESTVAEQKLKNIHVNDSVSKQEFINFRNTRDAALDMPKLILPAIQVNIRAGNKPPKEDNGIAYLKLPIDAL